MCVVVRNVRPPRVPGVAVAAVVVAAIVALGHDGIVIGQLRFSTDADAATLARQAAVTVHARPGVQYAYDQAVAGAEVRNETIDPADFIVAGDGTVTLTVRRWTHTLVLGRLVHSWEGAASTGSARWTP